MKSRLLIPVFYFHYTVPKVMAIQIVAKYIEIKAEWSYNYSSKSNDG